MNRITKGLLIVGLGALGMCLFYLCTSWVDDLKFLHQARLQNDRTVALKQAIQEQQAAQAAAPQTAPAAAPKSGGGQ